MATESPEQAALAISDPTPPPARRADSHSGGKKDDNPIKSTMDRDRIIKDGLEIKEAPHYAYIDSGDARNVKLPRDLIISVDELCGQWSDYLERKAADEKADFTELEEIIRDVAPKVRKWANFLEGGHAPGENDHLTQADLDAVYYLLMNEVEQRGAMMGYEVFLHPTRRGWRPEAQQFTATRRGVETPYTKYLAAHGQSREKIVEDLEKWEGVRINFEQALTGRGLRDKIFDRANWGISRTSMFRRDRSELRLHTEILHALEESDEPVIRNFIANHGHIQKVTDLLVSLDSPAERNIAIKAYHEAISKASAKRFQLKAGDLLKKLLEQREAVWEKEGYMDTAEKNLEALKREGQLTREQRTELDGLRDGLKAVKDKLRGKSEGADVVKGLPEKLKGLQDAISDYRKYSADHPLTDLKTRLRAEETIFRGYEKGRPPANPADVPEELARIKTDLDAERARLTNFKNGVVVPPAVAAATSPEIRAQQNTVTELEKAYGEAIKGYREIAHTIVTELKAEIATIEGQLSTKDAKIREQYGFIETEIPDHIVAITDLRNRLDRLAHPPAVGVPAVAPPIAAHLIHHVGLLDQQRDHLDRILVYLNGMLDGNPVAGGAASMRALRMTPNESTKAYVRRYNFNLDRNLFRTIVALPFEDEIRSYEEIMKGVHNEEREDKIKGIQLVLFIAGADPDGEGTLGKGQARLLVEGQNGGIMTEIRNTRSLAPVRDVICNHPEILGAKKSKKQGEDNEEESLGIGDTLLWQRVFSDVFILQSFVEWSVRRSGLEIPPSPVAVGAGFDLENVNDDFRQRVINKMTSNHIEFGRFLNYLVEKRLRDAGSQLMVADTLWVAEGNAATGGVVTYNNHNRIGPGATIFAVEDNTQFAERVRTQENHYYSSSSAEGEIDNIGVVRHSRAFLMHTLDIYSPRLDPLTLDIQDAGAPIAEARKRNIPLHIQLVTSKGGRQGGRFNISIQADPSLAGLGLNFLGRLDRRWVNLTSSNSFNDFEKYDDYNDLVTQIGTLLPGIQGDKIGDYILRTVGGYFLQLSPTQRLTEFGRFPDAAIIPARFPSLTNPNLGFQRISLDSSGVVELVRTVRGATTRISIDSALDGEFDVGGVKRKLNTAEAEELIRLTGEHVFNIVRR